MPLVGQIMARFNIKRYLPFQAGKAMHPIMCADRNGARADRDRHMRQGAGKWLLALVRSVKFALIDQLALFIHDLPPIDKVDWPFTGVLNCDIKPKDARHEFVHLHLNNIRRTCMRGNNR